MSRTRVKARGPAMRRAAAAADEVDLRVPLAKGVRDAVNKVFPTHFSFLFGEIALYSFVVLILSGTYLALWFDPSMTDITYDGAYDGLRGVDMSKAFASTLDISFQVRGGLFARQVHHWAALLFLAAITVHMLRIFFTGAFRKPREGNWVIGVTLMMFGIFEGFMGYSLGDDLLSGIGLRIAGSIILTIPVIGTWLEWAIFGGEYPGDVIISRMFTAHVLIVPGLLLALIAVHLGLVWYQKHTQFPGRRPAAKAEGNVVGTRMVPTFAAHSMSLAMAVIGVLCLLGGLAQINPIWHYGPYDPARVSTDAQPDWYMGWVEGAIRLFPPWLVSFGHYIIPVAFWPAVVLPLAMVFGMAVYPFIERRLLNDNVPHNLLQRPRDNPVRTGLGVMAVVFYGVLLLAGGDDVISYWLRVPIEECVWTERIGLFVLPVLAWWLTVRICRRLQRADRIVLAHGVNTGVIVRRPGGDFLEVRQPPPGYEDGEYDGAPVPRQVDERSLAERTAGSRGEVTVRR
ncbi:MAG TPA: ubiquinol-cytochrome c reductase cytochrome b subunit [Pseudonocardiaceae bacterium]|jgi:ubiquinol-cytochrome c reductase cytochrome b subunit|nr:ubiquinol-cytochrome c reductase cytochrome b subunit [Pseudonocardiaceae bacterium]